MSTQTTSHPIALQLLMTEDLYLADSAELEAPARPADPISVTAPSLGKEAVVAEVPPKAEPTFFEYLGENNKYTLVLVNELAHPIIGAKELETLTNILKGKKQEIKDVAIVNLHNYPTASFKALKEFFACNSIVFFGINPAQLGITEVQANQTTSHQSTKILATYSIAEMLSSPDKKREFWNQMKSL